MADVLHLAGPVLTGPSEQHDEAWVLGGRLTFERPDGDHDVTTVDGVVLPGLVDAHCHVGLDAHGAVPRDVQRTQAETDRDTGALLLRDAGSPADTRWIDDADDLPRIVRAGRHLARPGRYIRNFAHEIEPDQPGRPRAAGGPARRRVGRLVGDWIDRSVGDLAPCWPLDALTEAVRVAHEEGARVTAHVFGADAVPDLLAAGLDCLEHATGLDADTAALAAARGVAIVPTLVNIATFPGIAARGRERYPTYAAHMLDLHARRHATVRAAHEAGVPVYCGTDAGGSLPHGLVADEVAEPGDRRPDAGRGGVGRHLGAREWLGRGGLVEGAPADLVVLPADPRTDVSALRHPTAVVLRGRAFRPAGAA
ncbi:amidohydrolase [Angustibacter aerolatus]|uniref:Amidohydrolase n=1 Tax=Angustibacter aerolatus TaxID=1162965 RepID=A0ABQ6JLP4_9ACTN|nr:amidohydrolase family protein [Angustibacter aerolatus]GMA88814.1 amidohydrolase [Angustibacter aerolatus]